MSNLLYQHGGSILLVGAVIWIILKRFKKSRPRKKASRSRSPATDPVDNVIKALGRIDSTDYLGKAARAGKRARKAIEAGDFDGAWRYYHEQKMHYMGQAKRCEFTPAQTLALDGSVSRSLANILRVEERHPEALVHFIYYYCTLPRISKSDTKQLAAYFNRSKISAVDINDVQKFVKSLGSLPDFRVIQAMCDRWQKMPQSS